MNGFLGIFCTLFLAASVAKASTLVALTGQEAVVSVNAELGTLVQLPAPVKTVTPSQHFEIRNGEGSAAVDIRLFHVEPAANAVAETVTFVLSNGKALSLKLIPTPGGEKYVDIVFEKNVPASGSSLLASEFELMKAMILDETAGFSRHVAKELGGHGGRIEIGPLALDLRRIHASSEATGYVFEVRNISENPASIEPSKISFDRPNRALLAHVSSSRLASCPASSREPGCTAYLHLIVRGHDRHDTASLPVMVRSQGVAPFVTAAGEGAKL